MRAVVSGFGFSLGAALFRKVSDKLGLGEDKKGADSKSKADPEVAVGRAEGEGEREGEAS
ncbi:MAG TPA: hypothetical protein VKZ63_01585 [Kofleriaceae bacterium]|nr:hypothetical protein [Kofleriaceae bacterium]